MCYGGGADRVALVILENYLFDSPEACFMSLDFYVLFVISKYPHHPHQSRNETRDHGLLFDGLLVGNYKTQLNSSCTATLGGYEAI